MLLSMECVLVSAISLPMAQAAECMVIETYTMLNQHDENAILQFFNGTPPLLYCAPAHPNVSKYPNVEGEGWAKSEFLNPPHPLDPLVKRWPRQETRVTHWNVVAVGALHLMLATYTVSKCGGFTGVKERASMKLGLMAHGFWYVVWWNAQAKPGKAG